MLAVWQGADVPVIGYDWFTDVLKAVYLELPWGAQVGRPTQVRASLFWEHINDYGLVHFVWKFGDKVSISYHLEFILIICWDQVVQCMKMSIPQHACMHTVLLLHTTLIKKCFSVFITKWRSCHFKCSVEKMQLWTQKREREREREERITSDWFARFWIWITFPGFRSPAIYVFGQLVTFFDDCTFQYKEDPYLTWTPSTSHVYNRTGTYSLSVEAVNSVSSVTRETTIHVFGKTWLP